MGPRAQGVREQNAQGADVPDIPRVSGDSRTTGRAICTPAGTYRFAYRSPTALSRLK